MPRSMSLIVGLATLLSGLGCDSSPTLVLISVTSDLRVDEMDEVEIEVTTPTGNVRRSFADLSETAVPRTLELRHTGGSLGPHRALVTGRLMDTSIISERLDLLFAPNQTIRREVFLARDCLGVTCADDEVCRDGICVEQVGADAGTPDAGDAAIGLDAGVDSGPSSTATFEGMIGQAECGGAQSTFVLAEAIPAGDRIIVVAGWRLGSTAPASATDSGGNPYVALGPVGNEMKLSLLSAHIGTPLALGDSITVMHESGGARSTAAIHLSGISERSPIDAMASDFARDTSPSTALNTTVPTLTLGVVGNWGHTSLSLPDWTASTVLAPTCGGASVSADVRLFYRSDPAGGINLDGTLGSVQNWTTVMVALR